MIRLLQACRHAPADQGHSTALQRPESPSSLGEQRDELRQEDLKVDLMAELSLTRQSRHHLLVCFDQVTRRIRDQVATSSFDYISFQYTACMCVCESILILKYCYYLF